MRIRTIRRSDGEYLPLLIADDGVPLYASTVFTISELRVQNLALNTIKGHLRAVKHFEVFCQVRDIDLKARLDDGSLLSLGEVDDLVKSCRYPTEKLSRVAAKRFRLSAGRHPRVPPSQDWFRQIGVEHPIDLVLPAVARTRLKSILRYVEWLVRDRLSLPSINVPIRDRLESCLSQTVAAAMARSPRMTRRHPHTPREGLSHSERDRLFEVISPNSPNNPWTNEHTRFRNFLLIHWLLSLGIRRGEILGVRTSDIDFYGRRVSIITRPHTPDDPRIDQPVGKTLDRHLRLVSPLLHMTDTYLIEHRIHQGIAGKHNFLFVATPTGAPLSIVGVNKIFETLRDKCEQLPRNISAHTMRHTCNDLLSEQVDENNIDEETEKKIRCYIMGWSETSNTAALYTRRHTRIRAGDALVNLQKHMIGSLDE